MGNSGTGGKVLILTDGKAGHESQSRAFARALGRDFDLVEVHFKSRLHKALSYLFDRLGLRTTALFAPPAQAAGRLAERPAGHYEAVIGTGSGTFYAAKAVARRCGARCGVVLYPRGYDIGSFDCVLAPSFDRPKAAPNVVQIPVNLVAADAAFYEKGVAAFREHYRKSTGRPLPAPADAAAVIVGGPNRHSTMSVGWMKAELDRLFASGTASRYWVTTSRRTPPEVEALVDTYPWDYRLLYSRDRFNPIPAFVSLARCLCVTAESTGMISEACTSGTAEVRVLDNLNPGPSKFRRFVESLRAGGYVDGSRKVDLAAPLARARALMR